MKYLLLLSSRDLFLLFGTGRSEVSSSDHKQRALLPGYADQFIYYNAINVLPPDQLLNSYHPQSNFTSDSIETVTDKPDNRGDKSSSSFHLIDLHRIFNQIGRSSLTLLPQTRNNDSLETNRIPIYH